MVYTLLKALHFPDPTFVDRFLGEAVMKNPAFALVESPHKAINQATLAKMATIRITPALYNRNKSSEAERVSNMRFRFARCALHYLYRFKKAAPSNMLVTFREMVVILFFNSPICCWFLYKLIFMFFLGL